jgi:cytochrome c-type biogenesis protein
MNSTLAFAFGAGMVSTVNPCGFAMLPAFLAYYVGATRSDQPVGVLEKVAQGLRTGAAVSAGFVGVFTVVGLAVAVGLRFLIGAVPWFAVAIGAVLVLLGVVLALGGRLPVRLNANRLMRPGDGPRSMMAFGAAYAIASLSCTLAVLLAVIGSTLASSSVLLLLGVFAAYGAGASTVLLLLTVSTALASGALECGLRRIARVVDRVAGAILALSGLYLIVYWVPVLAGARPNSALSGSADGVSGRLQALVAGNIGVVTAIAGTAVGAALLVVLAARWRARGSHPDGGENADDSGCCADAQPVQQPPAASARLR